ncbi:putative disease resistance protein RGA4 isoform X2 [Punica granatum]|nr:putative disease resistance protein RGA4 isoform X2 [Punica granatum]
MGLKIKEIRTRLDEINKEKDAFNLIPQTSFNGGSRSRWRETHSHVNVSEIIGRDSDRDEIIKKLLSPPADKNPFIVSIVGIGGMGKTALTKLLYNNDRVKLHFDSRIWVCVSEEFDLKITLQKIIKSATEESTTIQNIHLLDLEQLQAKLQELLQDNKFLLVLDDVWSNNRGQWNELRDLLTGGTTGSSVIVTTRSSEVASAAGSRYEHKLKGLSQGDSITILKKVSDYGQGSVTNPELLEIARQLVDKSGGVPLVVKALGGLLRSNTDIRYWRYIRDKGMLAVLQKEDDILPIIKLSYDHLTADLKRCFAFCSLFPKDYRFLNIELNQYWIASGLVILNNNQRLEEPCDHCMKEFLARSFFQDVEDCGAVYFFKMHDLVHDLASSIAQNEYSVAKFDTASISDRVRHVELSYSSNNETECVPPFLSQAKKLQTLLCMSSDLGISGEVLKACISNCKYLRVLDLTNSTFEVLPDNIDSLRHLRLVDLSKNLKIKRLPKSICNLQSLQFLYLHGCESLEELPRDMWKLINLQALSVATKQKSLKGSDIEYLKSLQFFRIEVCRNLETLFEGMNIESHASLRTFLIKDCDNLTSIPMSSIKFLTSLEVLSFWNCGKLALSMEEEIFSSCLRTLTFYGLPMMLTFPKWVQGAANTLQRLHIGNCLLLEELPEWLHKLSCLETLIIAGCNGISTLPDGVQDLTALKCLRISFCGELGDKCRPDGPDWHKIAHVPDIEIDGEKIVRS